jgi:hypothetical protein
MKPGRFVPSLFFAIMLALVLVGSARGQVEMAAARANVPL